MTIKKLSIHQINELSTLFMKAGILDTGILNIGVVIETGDLIVEYEKVGPYPELNVGIETVKIPFNKPIKW